MSRVERWERRTEIPLLLLALAFLVAYAWPIVDPDIHRDLESFLSVVSWTVWAAFLVDFVVRLALATDRLRYAVRHWYDVVLIVAPLLRPLRLLRALAFARILGRTMVHNLAGRVIVYVVGTAVVTIGLGALAVLDVERHAHGSNIRSLGDALWWAAATATTVGYGDRYPVTTLGRVIAVALMLVGIALIGSITAAIASWFVSLVAEAREAQSEDQLEESVDESTAAILDSLADLKQQVAALEARLGERTDARD